jgi:hypothetical protein
MMRKKSFTSLISESEDENRSSLLASYGIKYRANLLGLPPRSRSEAPCPAKKRMKISSLSALAK